MTKASPLLVISFVLFGVSNLQGASQCPGNAESVQYHSLKRFEITIPVTINGSGPYEFMVDTGSESTIIEPSLAAELGLKPIGNADVVAGVRHIAANVVAPEVIEVGSHTFHQHSISVASLAHLRELHTRLRGILGEDFLMGFDLLIDRGKKILCLDPTADMRGSIRGERISIVRQGIEDPGMAQSILVPVRLSGQKSRTMYLRLDSGANTPILYVNPSKWEPRDERAKALRANVVGGSTESFKTIAPLEIRIGNHIMSDITFAAPIASKQNVVFAGEDGLLPTSSSNAFSSATAPVFSCWNHTNPEVRSAKHRTVATRARQIR